MAHSDSRTVIITLPDDMVCELRFGDKRKVVVFPPGCETGWHKASKGYEMRALTTCNLTRYSKDGKKLPGVKMKPGDKIKRKAGIAHNVVNDSDDVAVLLK